jgi:hypothetical protein
LFDGTDYECGSSSIWDWSWSDEDDWIGSCSGTIPTNGQSNATKQKYWVNWTYSTTPWNCTYSCNSWYYWDGNECVEYLTWTATLLATYDVMNGDNYFPWNVYYNIIDGEDSGLYSYNYDSNTFYLVSPSGGMWWIVKDSWTKEILTISTWWQHLYTLSWTKIASISTFRDDQYPEGILAKSILDNKFVQSTGTGYKIENNTATVAFTLDFSGTSSQYWIKRALDDSVYARTSWKRYSDGCPTNDWKKRYLLWSSCYQILYFDSNHTRYNLSKEYNYVWDDTLRLYTIWDWYIKRIDPTNENVVESISVSGLWITTTVGALQNFWDITYIKSWNYYYFFNYKKPLDANKIFKFKVSNLPSIGSFVPFYWDPNGRALIMNYYKNYSSPRSITLNMYDITPIIQYVLDNTK